MELVFVGNESDRSVSVAANAGGVLSAGNVGEVLTEDSVDGTLDLGEEEVALKLSKLDAAEGEDPGLIERFWLKLS